MKGGKRKNSNSAQKSWKKNFHIIPCCNCQNPTKASAEADKILCGDCVVNDPLNGFARYYNKPFKTFKMASRYLEATTEVEYQPSKKVVPKAKSSGPAPLNKMQLWYRAHKNLSGDRL